MYIYKKKHTHTGNIKNEETKELMCFMYIFFIHTISFRKNDLSFCEENIYFLLNSLSHAPFPRIYSRFFFYAQLVYAFLSQPMLWHLVIISYASRTHGKICACSWNNKLNRYTFTRHMRGDSILSFKEIRILL